MVASTTGFIELQAICLSSARIGGGYSLVQD